MATREEVDALIADSQARQKSRLTARAMAVGVQNAPDVSLEMRGTGTTAPTPDFIDSAFQGVKHGLAFGSNDELAGMFGRAGQALGNATSGVDPSFQETDGYKVARDAERAKDEAAKAAHPVANFAGNVGGGILGVAGGVGAASRLAPALAAKAPALAAPLAKAGNYLADMPALQKLLAAGGVQGAAQGVGEADTVGDIPKDAAIGAGSGALLSLLGAGAGKAVGSVARGVMDTFTPEAAATARLLQATGLTGGGGPDLLKKVATVPGGREAFVDTAKDLGILGGLKSTQSVLADARAARAEAAGVGDALRGAADDAGVRMPVARFTDKLRAAADAILPASGPVAPGATSRAELADVAQALRDKAQFYDETLPYGMTLKEMQDAVTTMGNDANWVKRATGAALPGAQEAAATATRAGRRAMDETLQEAAQRGVPIPDSVMNASRVFPEGVLPADVADVAKQARRAVHVSRTLDEAAASSVDKSMKNRFMGLIPTILGAGAMAGGTGVGPALGVAATAHAVNSYGSGARASAMEAAASAVQALKASPALKQRLGEAGDALMNAAQLGGPMLLLEYLHQRKDPEVARALDEATAPQPQQSPTMRALSPLMGSR